jgi:hypothetical protein
MFIGHLRTLARKPVNAGEKVIHYGRSGPEPVIQPGEPPVDGDAVGTLQQFLNSFSHSLA